MLSRGKKFGASVELSCKNFGAIAAAPKFRRNGSGDAYGEMDGFFRWGMAGQASTSAVYLLFPLPQGISIIIKTNLSSTVIALKQ